jgi:hypothetical protein
MTTDAADHPAAGDYRRQPVTLTFRYGAAWVDDVPSRLVTTRVPSCNARSRRLRQNDIVAKGPHIVELLSTSE